MPNEVTEYLFEIIFEVNKFLILSGQGSLVYTYCEPMPDQEKIKHRFYTQGISGQLRTKYKYT